MGRWVRVESEFIVMLWLRPSQTEFENTQLYWKIFCPAQPQFSEDRCASFEVARNI